MPPQFQPLRLYVKQDKSVESSAYSVKPVIIWSRGSRMLIVPQTVYYALPRLREDLTNVRLCFKQKRQALDALQAISRKTIA
jgi:hypothetical protein